MGDLCYALRHRGRDAHVPGFCCADNEHPRRDVGVSPATMVNGQWSIIGTPTSLASPRLYHAKKGYIKLNTPTSERFWFCINLGGNSIPGIRRRFPDHWSIRSWRWRTALSLLWARCCGRWGMNIRRSRGEHLTGWWWGVRSNTKVLLEVFDVEHELHESNE